MHQALDNRLIEVTTVVKLSLGGGKGGRFLRFNLQLFLQLFPVRLLEPGLVGQDYRTTSFLETKDSQVLLQTDLLNASFNIIMQSLKT